MIKALTVASTSWPAHLSQGVCAGLVLYGMVFGKHPFTKEGDQEMGDCFAAGRRSAK
jgi:hypothetical protein